MRVTLKEYLLQLQAHEARKPPAQRRAVPTLHELGEAIGVSRPTISRFANNHTHLINAEMVSALITVLREQGFETTLTDLFAYDEPQRGR